jgi:NADH dehydrogenase (ubiquinone) 1 beta subcomplex subunit 8
MAPTFSQMNHFLSWFQMHEREELYSMWGPDIPHVAPATALRQFTIALSGFVAFGLLCNYALVPERPAISRQFPFDGLVKELGGLEENKVSFFPPPATLLHT